MNNNTASDPSQGVAFVRGSYVPIAEAAIPLTDWGFLRSDATYDVVTVWDGSFFRLDAHLERFMRSCERFRLDPGLAPREITEVLAECVRRSGLRNSYVEMIVRAASRPGARAIRGRRSTGSMPSPSPSSGSPTRRSASAGCT